MTVERQLDISDDPEELQQIFVPIELVQSHIKEYWRTHTTRKTDAYIQQQADKTIACLRRLSKYTFAQATLFDSEGKEPAFISTEILHFFGDMKTDHDFMPSLKEYRTQRGMKAGRDGWGTTPGIENHIAGLRYASSHVLKDWNNANE